MIKIRVWLRYGGTLDIRCESWNTRTNNGKLVSWEAEGSDNKFWIDPSEIVAWQKVK